MEASYQNSKLSDIEEFRHYDLQDRRTATYENIFSDITYGKLGKDTKEVFELITKYLEVEDGDLFKKLISDLSKSQPKYLRLLSRVFSPDGIETTDLSSESYKREVAKGFLYVAEHPTRYDDEDYYYEDYDSLYLPLKLDILPDDPNEQMLPFELLQPLILHMSFESIVNFYQTSQQYRNVIDNPEVLFELKNKFDLYKVNKFEDLYDQYLLTYPTSLSYETCMSNHNIDKYVNVAIENGNELILDRLYQSISKISQRYESENKNQSRF